MPLWGGFQRLGLSFWASYSSRNHPSPVFANCHTSNSTLFMQRCPTMETSSLCNYGSSIQTGKHIRFPFSCVNQFLILRGYPSHGLKRYNSVPACNYDDGSNSFPASHKLKSPNGIIAIFRQDFRPESLKPCKVKDEDSEGALNGENIILEEQSLEKELLTAIKEENYAQAAKIRDNLRLLQEDSKASVLAANARFYNAFRIGDLVAMQTLWSKGDHVCVVHPGVSGISGYDLVMGSWEFVWAEYAFPLDIQIKDVQVHVRSDTAYVTCIEMVMTKGSSWGKQFATNVFERIEGQWFMCVHHASYIDL